MTLDYAQMEIVPGKRVGPFRIGMSKAEARRSFDLIPEGGDRDVDWTVDRGIGLWYADDELVDQIVVVGSGIGAFRELRIGSLLGSESTNIVHPKHETLSYWKDVDGIGVDVDFLGEDDPPPEDWARWTVVELCAFDPHRPFAYRYRANTPDEI